MNDRTKSRADLHVHSKHSDRPSEWFLRRIGAPECFAEPREIYDEMRGRGMDFVTLSDHNCIDGALEIAAVARKTGKQLTVLTCQSKPPQERIDLKNCRPVGTFALPEYELLELCFPPFLEIIEYIERNRFNELIISTPGPLGLTALAAAKLLGIRTIGIYHTDFPSIARHLTDDEAVEQITWKYMHWFYESVDWVVAPSQYYRKQLVSRGFDPKKVAVMIRGVDLDRFRPVLRDERFWDRWGPGRGFKFIYVGRVSADKNVELAITSFLDLLGQGADAHLAVVGDGPLLKGVRKRFQHRRIAFTGFLQGEDLPTALASADVMVFPSTTDTFGNAVLEAQACGLPAIVSDQGGPQEIVVPHASGIAVDVARPGAVTEAMARLLHEPALRADMRRRALANAADRNWPQVLDELWNRRDHASHDPAIPELGRLAQPSEPAEINAGVT